MIEKEYYRFTELESRFGITNEDISYYVNKGTLEIWAYKDTSKYVVGGWENGKGLIAHGIATYRGLIKILVHDQRKLLVDKRLSINTFGILNNDNISHFSTKCPFDVKLPSGPIHLWTSTDTTRLSWKEIVAIRIPRKGKHPRNLLATIVEASEKTHDTSKPSVLAQVPSSLLEQSLKVSLEEVCVRHEDIVNLGLIEPSTKSNSSVNLNSNVKVRSSDFHELLLKILHKSPRISAKKCEQILSKEAALLRDEREFDKGGILIDVSETELVWESRRKIRQHFKLSSLGATISKLRNPKKSSNI